MSKLSKWLLAACLMLAVACFALFKANKSLNDENTRLGSNQKALLDKATYYQTEAGKSAASVQKLELSYEELKDNYQDICNVADELGIKVKRLQSVATTATVTDVNVETKVKDSIIYKNGLIDSVKAFKWRDAWVDVAGTIKGDDVSLGMTSKDTLIQIIHRVPRKFLFFRWGTKAIRQEITSTNPHSKIIYTDYIELK
jgi:hypothetical protein